MKTIKTIDSYSDNNESVLSTSCGNQTKLIEKMIINKKFRVREKTFDIIFILQ